MRGKKPAACRPHVALATFLRGLSHNLGISHYERGKKVRAVLEYFCCVIGDTSEAWPCCSSKSDGDML
jgi:hypothetical protein